MIISEMLMRMQKATNHSKLIISPVPQLKGAVLLLLLVALTFSACLFITYILQQAFLAIQGIYSLQISSVKVSTNAYI